MLKGTKSIEDGSKTSTACEEPSDLHEQEQLIFKLREAIGKVKGEGALGQKGVLLQVWMPILTSGGAVILQTESLPFSISAIGDSLALFRCSSCQHSFSTDPSKPDKMGYIGRVFSTAQPEFCLNVLRNSKTTYLGLGEARRCQVSSVLAIPIFETEQKLRPSAVLEIAHSDKDPDIKLLTEKIIKSLSDVGLWTCDLNIDEFINKDPTDLPTLNIFNTDFISNSVKPDTSPKSNMNLRASYSNQFKSSSYTENSSCELAATSPRPESFLDGSCINMATSIRSGNSMEESFGNFSSGGDIDSSEDNNVCSSPSNPLNSSDTRQRNYNRLGGGAGKRLTYQDLEKFFNYNLKAASRELGICPTTLKRACRRNGISRWPSRQLVKLLKTWKHLGYEGNPPKWLRENAINGNLRRDSLEMALSTGVFLRMQNSRVMSEQHSIGHEGESAHLMPLIHSLYNNPSLFRNSTHHGYITPETNSNVLVDTRDFFEDSHCKTWHAGQNFQFPSLQNSNCPHGGGGGSRGSNSPIFPFDFRVQQSLASLNNSNFSTGYNDLEDTQKGQCLMPMLLGGSEDIYSFEGLGTMNDPIGFEPLNLDEKIEVNYKRKRNM